MNPFRSTCYSPIFCSFLVVFLLKESIAVLQSIHETETTILSRRGCTRIVPKRNLQSKHRIIGVHQQQILGINDKAWPPFPFNLILPKRQQIQEQESPTFESKSKMSSTTTGIPIGVDLFFRYCASRGKMYSRQIQSIASSLVLHLPPAAPPLVLLALLPVEKQHTNAAITLHRFSRRIALTCLGVSVISWAHCELRKNKRLTPLPLRVNSQSTMADEWSTVLPPFLPEALHQPTKIPTTNYSSQLLQHPFNNHNLLNSIHPEGKISNSNQSMIVFQKWQSQILQTTKNAPQTLAATCQEWQKSRIMRRNERHEKRRLEIYEQLVAFQGLKRAIRANHQEKHEQPISSSPLGWALVTGASKGIGRALAVELARWEIPIVLVARDVDKLKLLATELGQCYGVPCCVLQADLTKLGVEHRIHRATEDAGIKVDILVNNAGLAYCGELVETESSVLENVMRLNAHVVTCLTKLYGKDMKERRRGRILFVSSVTGAFPGVPGSAVYAASKSYQRSLATSLAKELEPYGVGVTHILPGAVRGTQFGQESNIQNALCWKYPFYSRSSQEVASRGIRALLCGDTEVIPGLINRLWLKVLQPMLPQRISTMVAEVSWSPFHFKFSPLLFDPFWGGNPNNQISSESKGQKWDEQFSIAPNNNPIILSLDIEEHLSEKKSDVSSEFAQIIDSQFGRSLNSSKEEQESEIHYHQVDKSKCNND